MKRKTEKIPEFDEIVFANRNRSYGAYDLRKKYKAVTSWSVLIAVTISVITLVAISLDDTDAIASVRKTEGVIVEIDPLVPVEKVKKPDEMPQGLEKALKNMKPIVTEDTSEVTDYIPTTEEIIEKITDPGVNDTLSYNPESDPIIVVEPEPQIVVEEMPQYPGGQTELLKYVAENLKYPAVALENNIQGSVILKFVVRSDGSVDRIEMLRGVDPALDNEAIRVIKTLPRFVPGKQGGVPVPVWFTIPVTFRIMN